MKMSPVIMWVLNIIIWIVTGLPLLIYPFVMLADIMALAAPWSPITGIEDLACTILALTVYLTTLLYPAVYVGLVGVSVVLAIVSHMIKHRRIWFRTASLICALIPVAYLVFVVLCVICWSSLSCG
jgi:hypothetical protein